LEFISNAFVIIVSSNPDIDREIAYINKISQDFVPVTVIKSSDNFSKTMLARPPTSLKEFKKNIDPYIGENTVNILDEDMYKVDTSEISNVDLFFYDGPHEYEHIYKTVIRYRDCFAKQAILVFDDANWTDTVMAADQAVKDAGLTSIYSKKVLNSTESKKDWWNGIYIIVVA
jgi:hypothetical protein